MRMKDKVAIVTGAGSGIGKATAKLFAQEGARVALVGRRERLLDEVRGEIEKKFGDSIVVGADVSDPSQVTAMVNKVIKYFGRVDVLFNNAGIGSAPFSIVEVPMDDWSKVIDTNLTGSFLCCRDVIPNMILNGGGSIVNCGSISAHIGQVNQGAYNAAKAGLEALTRCIALDFAPKNIRCNNVSPAWVETDMNRENIRRLREEGGIGYERALALHPLGRFGRPEDVAFAALFLASDEASWITGISLLVDGGYTAQ